MKPDARTLTFAAAINEALGLAMAEDPAVICYGLGVDDPKGVFGTTLGLPERFGPDRIFDMPTSEAAMTGIAIGASLAGIRPVMVHQRLDFFLLAMDQLVNNAAKWSYMFGGVRSVPIVIRLILGRGWGQGPTHSQNLQAWFAHIPGLKVLMPTTPEDAKGMLLAAIRDPNPVVFLEHRWLHNTEGHVPSGVYHTPLGRVRPMAEGKDFTLVTLSYQTIEALHALPGLHAQGVRPDLLDLRSVTPLDWGSIFASVEKTGRLVVADTASVTCSVGSEIVARVARERFSSLKAAPVLLALPDIPSPTSPALSAVYYGGAEDIVRAAGQVMGRALSVEFLAERKRAPHDVPGTWFKGPF